MRRSVPFRQRIFHIRQALQEWVPQRNVGDKMRCDVIDINGNHCPQEAGRTLSIGGEEVHLCELCFLNFQAGAYRRNTPSRRIYEVSGTSGIYSTAKIVVNEIILLA